MTEPLEPHLWHAWKTNRTVPSGMVTLAWIAAIVMALAAAAAWWRISNLPITVHLRDQTVSQGTVALLPERSALDRIVTQWVTWSESWTDETLEATQASMLATIHPLTRLETQTLFKSQLEDAKNLHRAQNVMVLGMQVDNYSSDAALYHIAIRRCRYVNAPDQNNQMVMQYQRQDLIVLTIQVVPDVVTESNRLGIAIRDRQEVESQVWLDSGKEAFWVKPDPLKKK